MALSYKARRRLSLFLLLVWLPLFVVAAITIIGMLDRPPVWLEVVIYASFGVVWALPFRFAFRGVGKAAPEEDPDDPKS